MPLNPPPAPDAGFFEHLSAHWSVLMAYWPVLVISFGVALLMTPLCRWFALKRGIVDKPDDYLKPHRTPIAYLGGVAIFLGWLAGVLYGYFEVSIHPLDGSPAIELGALKGRQLLGIMLAGAAVMVIGLMDDLRFMSPKVKLVGIVLVALLLIVFGLGDSIIMVVVHRLHVGIAPDERWLVLVYSVPITVFIVVGACNATNLIDGLDGLCSGVQGIIALGFVILSVHLHVHNPAGPLQIILVVLSMALMGCSLGFLPFNINPAKVFMGDAGSMLLGLNSAIIVLLFAEEQKIRWMLAALVIFGLPIADMLLTLVRRWRAEKPLMIGDRSHFYDQLVDRGLSVRKVVGISYVLTLLFVLLGLLAIFMRMRHILIIDILFALALAFAIHKLKMVRTDSPAPGRTPPRSSRHDS